jgi:ribosome-associated heat shock protein Hsp15
MTDPEESSERHRLDRWLWFTRFFKTRSLATQTVSLGRVTLNGARVRPAHAVQVGDRIAISQDRETRDVIVRDLPVRRGPAPEAQACYSETEESQARRAVARETRKLAEMSHPRTLGRPDKRDRRQLDRLRRRQGD